MSNPVPAAGPLSEQDEFVQRLTEPHSGMIDGQPLRLGILHVAQPQTQPDRHINIWIDRKVNPDDPVSPGQLGPTRYASLCQLARAANCACYPLDNCVLIGRPTWVAELSRRILAADNPSMSSRQRARSTDHSPAFDLQWPELTTPSEAIQLAQGGTAVPAGFSQNAPVISTLPHDLWPAVLLRDISPQVAIGLITGQFIDDPKAERLSVPWTRAYQFAGGKSTLESLRDLDPNLQVTSRAGTLQVLGSAALHQAFCQQILGSAAAPPSRPEGGDALERLQSNPRVFSLKVIDKPAGALIATLVGQLDIDCQFDPAANPQLEKLVSFSAVDQTLWQLVRLIAEKASLKIQADGDKLRLSPLK